MKLSSGGSPSRLTLPRERAALLGPIESSRRRLRTDLQPPRNGRTLLSEDDWRSVGRMLCLSPRELELVQHIFEGKKLLAIAQEMNLSLGTVKTYCQRAYLKLRVTSQRELTLVILSAHLAT